MTKPIHFSSALRVLSVYALVALCVKDAGSSGRDPPTPSAFAPLVVLPVSASPNNGARLRGLRARRHRGPIAEPNSDDGVASHDAHHRHHHHHQNNQLSFADAQNSQLLQHHQSQASILRHSAANRASSSSSSSSSSSYSSDQSDGEPVSVNSLY
eukprot:Selendium_serpulae@DN7956_c0_g1_i1.p1